MSSLRRRVPLLIGAVLLLLAVTAVWGSTFFLIRDLVDHVPSADFLAVRFGIAAVLMFVLFSRQTLALTRREALLGAGLGLLYAAAQLLGAVRDRRRTGEDAVDSVDVAALEPATAERHDLALSAQVEPTDDEFVEAAAPAALGTKRAARRGSTAKKEWSIARGAATDEESVEADEESHAAARAA